MKRFPDWVFGWFLPKILRPVVLVLIFIFFLRIAVSIGESTNENIGSRMFGMFMLLMFALVIFSEPISEFFDKAKDE